MSPVRRALIDVGTNSVKLLVAQVNGREVLPLWEGSHQTRLGQGFYETHRLQAGPIAQTAQAVADFATKARQESVQSIRLIATSAARDALNAEELRSALQQASGLKLEIISGQQEAQWAFQGVTSDAQLAGEPLLLLDVGGGSTEFIVGQGAATQFRHSFSLGTVRLLELIPHSEPPQPAELAACCEWVKGFLNREVRPQLQPALESQAAIARAQHGAIQLVGTGGTASVLGCMEARLQSFDRARLEATRLSAERLSWHLEHLWQLPLAARRQVVGLPANRADVILTGTVIYRSIMEAFGFAELRLSTRGLRFGALME